MSPAQFKIVSDLYNNYHEAFLTLSAEIRYEWYSILYSKKENQQ